MTSVPPDLLDAYRRTEYRVADGSYAFVLRIDEPSDSLRTCHAAFGVDCSTFITACNPRSAPTAPDINEEAMRRLLFAKSAHSVRDSGRKVPAMKALRARWIASVPVA